MAELDKLENEAIESIKAYIEKSRGLNQEELEQYLNSYLREVFDYMAVTIKREYMKTIYR